MSITEKLPSLLVGAFVIGGLAVVGSKMFSSSDGGTVVDVTVPTLGTLAAAGETAFNETCAQCHGKNAAGTDQGPPLVHKIYNPGHHGDASFQNAVRQGVGQHHWTFGNMPPQVGVDENQVKSIIAYVRALQTANGITYQPHNM